ncbi:response regulator transcription factor [Streptomyces kanamyceticus]|uniref:DNA-binding response regulator n=1 Tax=Streptomyces kanamyceticus TaxID=1967 RepID=A0A5J6GH23_STRKN|nr:LuxR C-terminal-related transcriptional regulator [Streptomyces kanamyceticus]QEU93311.1 DNA-binding response regulator [Streptomyces kanamyceticus]
MPEATMCTARSAHEGRGPAARPPALVRKTSLHGVLRALGHDPRSARTTVDACLVWLAEVLVEIAVRAEDAHTATVLADEASATLAMLSTRAPPEEAGAPGLTPSELVVLSKLPGTVPLRGIADELHVSLNTVRSHTRAVYRKLGVGSRTQAVYRARELDLL